MRLCCHRQMNLSLKFTEICRTWPQIINESIVKKLQYNSFERQKLQCATANIKVNLKDFCLPQSPVVAYLLQLTFPPVVPTKSLWSCSFSKISEMILVKTKQNTVSQQRSKS